MNMIARLLMTLALLSGLSSNAVAGIKCWTNKEGTRECGDAVPPEYAQKQNRTLNEHGITVEVTKRAKSGSELEAEIRRKKAEEERAAEEKRRMEAQQKTDKILLASFASEQDITMARDRKVAALEGVIEFTNTSIAKHRKKVEGYDKRIAAFEGKGKPVPANLAKNSEAEQQRLDKKLAYVAAKKAEIEALRTEYSGYLNRYRQIMRQRGR